MPRYRVRRKIEQETTVVADNEHDAEDMARGLHELEWTDTGYVELEVEYDLRKHEAPKPSKCPKELLN